MRAFVPLLIAFALVLSGCCGFAGNRAPLTPLNLTYSVALDPSVSFYIVDNSGARISSIDSDEWFYPVQRGLPNGTAYGFRLLKKGGPVPVNEEFIALPAAQEPNFQVGAQQYHGFDPDKYTVELVRIEGEHGTIVARTNITVTNRFAIAHDSLDAISKNCSQYMPAGKGMYGSMEAQGARDLYGCIRDFAVSQGDMEICKGITTYINNSFWDIDGCIGDFAVNKSDLSLCEKRQRAVDRAICRAEILNSYEECSIMQCDFYWSCDQQKDICLQSFAMSHKNDALCLQISDEQIRIQCLGLVLADESYCNKLTDAQSRDSCLQYARHMHSRDAQNGTG